MWSENLSIYLVNSFDMWHFTQNSLALTIDWVVLMTNIHHSQYTTDIYYSQQESFVTSGQNVKQKPTSTVLRVLDSQYSLCSQLGFTLAWQK